MIDLNAIPHSPGCYIYKDFSETIIYIGKAKDLRKRVSSYFQKKDHDVKTEMLVRSIDSIDFIATSTEMEALILENTLIKKHQPKYNIDLKDSRQYAYLIIKDENYPRLMLARDQKQKGQYFGPFVSGKERMDVLEFLNNTFRLRTCKRFPKRPCLRYHIKLCDAPCTGLISESEYDTRIRYVKSVLKGKTSDVIKQLESDMKSESSRKNFELAIDYRNKIEALNNLSERQNMQRSKKYDEDVINYEIRDGRVYLLMFNIYKGTLANKREFIFDEVDGSFEDFIKQYYSEGDVPKEIIVPHMIDDKIQDYLSDRKKSTVRINVPKIGEKKKLLNLARKNIELTFFRNLAKLDALYEKLKLPSKPYVMECFDISHLSGSSTVASMVQFRAGKPDKSNYRRFKINTVDGIDDFKSIAEVVRRRYRRLVSEDMELPDLIIIDGGKGQLSSAHKELRQLGLNIPMISLAKRDEEIFVPGLSVPIKLSKKEPALQLLQEIRDEAHRFAITYNRLLRKKSLLD